ncbi:MAG: hypothetical protein DME65_04835 [Verrucomicrobia bacterium]|nr:MAG: hypothetical protein DME65_04835 [Verrucomicrobiota bacterium]
MSSRQTADRLPSASATPSKGRLIPGGVVASLAATALLNRSLAKKAERDNLSLVAIIAGNQDRLIKPEQPSELHLQIATSYCGVFLITGT